PRDCPPYLGRSDRDACGVERRKHRPSTIDIVGAPTAEPTPLALLLASQVSQSCRNSRMVRPVADLDQKADTTRADIRSRRVEQSPMVGKRDGVQLVVGIISVEGSPPAIAALHADDPLGCAVDRGAIAR